MSTRLTDANAIFFAQLALVGPFVVALAAAWQFLKAASWFDGTVEKPLRAEESGARPIATPLIADGSRSVTKAGVEVADIRPRFLAYVVDVIVAALLSAIPVALASLLLQGTTALLVGGLLAFVVVTLYFPYFWHATGQTPGMRVTKVRVVHEIHVGPISWGTAIKRYVVFVFGALAFYIGWLWVFVDPRKKAWHDIAADTIVIDASTALTATTEAAIAAETVERAPVDPDDPTQGVRHRADRGRGRSARPRADERAAGHRPGPQEALPDLRRRAAEADRHGVRGRRRRLRGLSRRDVQPRGRVRLRQDDARADA